MNYNVLPIPPFDRQLKRLSKKYPSLKQEYFGLIESLEENPEQGTNLGNNCYKLRMAIYLLTVFDKSDQENISNKELALLVEGFP